MKEILLLTIGFSPNIGGIETHFDDLIKVLDEDGYKTWVLTYKPLTTDIFARFLETKGKNIRIFRLPVLRGFFYRFVHTPFLEFIFLFPGLFFFLPFLLLTRCKNVKTIHTHGLIAGFVGVFWGRLFGKRVITTTHSIYNFPGKGLYRSFASLIFGRSNHILTLSKQSKEEIEKLGIDPKKISVFTYWIDLKKFKPIERAKEKLGWNNKFVVLFVGRLVEEKGVSVLLESVKEWNRNITLVVVGIGPLEFKVKVSQEIDKNIVFIGRVDNEVLPFYYSAADLLIMPSISEEGFGRVILESLACGTPVVGSNRGAIPEAMDETVGSLIDPAPDNITKTVENLYKNSDKLRKLSENARKYAERKYSEKNALTIIKQYEQCYT